MTPWSYRLTALLFCLLIFGLAVLTLLHSPVGFSQTENRTLAQMPRLSAAGLLNGSFEAAYEDYLSDQFIGRDHWIALKTLAERLTLSQESKDIYFAKDGYLIEKHTGVFSSEQAGRNAETLAAFALQTRDQFAPGRFRVMIIPNAVTILRDKLPPLAPPSDEEAYLKRLAGALPDQVFFDAAPILRAHSDEPLYYRTDHHWTTRAAFYVYQAWMDAQSCAVPALSDYAVQTVSTSFQGTIQSKLGIQTPGDTLELFLTKEPVSCAVLSDGVLSDTLYDARALDTKDQYAFYLGGNHARVNIQTGAGGDRKLLVIKDSYANCFIPFLTQSFREIDVLDLRYTRQRVSELLASGGYTDLLILYNAAGFAADTGLSKLTR